MNADRRITAKYLADLAELNPELVRRYARQLREMLANTASERRGSE